MRGRNGKLADLSDGQLTHVQAAKANFARVGRRADAVPGNLRCSTLSGSLRMHLGHGETETLNASFEKQPEAVISKESGGFGDMWRGDGRFCDIKASFAHLN